MNSKLVINWSELSRLMAGSRSVVSANRMPTKHKIKVDKLLRLIEKWYLDEFPDNGA